MHWNIFQSRQPTDLCNNVTPVCSYRFTFSWLHYCDSTDCLNHDRCWRATTAPRNWLLWGCKPIPPFAHQRPRLGYPWQDLDRELSANFGYFRCLHPPLHLPVTRQSCSRCCIAGPDYTTVVTSQIKWPTQINFIILNKSCHANVFRLNCTTTARITWLSYHQPFLSNAGAYHFVFIISGTMDWT